MGPTPRRPRRRSTPLVPDDDLEAAREAATRWAGRGGAREDVPALARHLARKGFSRRAIVQLSREAGNETAGEGDDE